jgi:hypothetical protein
MRTTRIFFFFFLTSCQIFNEAPEAERFPLEEGVAWYSTGEVESWRTIVR